MSDYCDLSQLKKLFDPDDPEQQLAIRIIEQTEQRGPLVGLLLQLRLVIEIARRDQLNQDLLDLFLKLLDQLDKQALACLDCPYLAGSTASPVPS